MEELRPHASVSQVLKYARCPEEYRLSYIDKKNPYKPTA